MTINQSSPNEQQQRIALLLSYYGPAFSGCQYQKNAYTVQEALSNALYKLGIAHGPITFAGRTDAGVHAKGQVAHFDAYLGTMRRIKDPIAALNATLPDSISIQDIVCSAHDRFHSTILARHRWYQYRIYNQPTRSVWMRPDAALITSPLDIASMQAASAHFIGQKDFTSLKCPRALHDLNICHVIHSQVSEDGADIVFDIVSNRFIYKMVRNIMGLLIEVGRGDLSPEEIPGILAAKDRQAAGHTAQPHGLSFMAAAYDAPWDYFQNHVYVTKLNQLRMRASDMGLPPVTEKAASSSERFSLEKIAFSPAPS